MESHGLVTYVGGQGFRLGPRLLGLAATAMRELPLRDLAQPVLDRLARSTGESAQLFVRDHHRRVCIAAAESRSELRTIVEIGAELPLTAGSAGKVFLAFGPPRAHRGAPRDRRSVHAGDTGRRAIGAPARDRTAAGAGRRARENANRAWDRSARPIHEPYGALLAVVSLSGPEQRVGRISAKRYAPAVVEAAKEIEGALGA